MPSPAVEKADSLPATVVVLATGGTIAGTASGTVASGYVAAQLGVEALVEAVPPLQAWRSDGRLEARQLAQIDSKDMSFAVWRELAQAVAVELERPEVAGVVVTHGTDTLEETAYLLHRLLAPHKPVVLTAAMRPATALSADGPQNLLDAVRLAARPGVSGVLAVLNQAVWAGAEVRKRHTWQVDAFGCDAGPLAWVQGETLRSLRPWPGQSAAPLGAALLAQAEPWPWVEVVHSHAGADGRVVDSLVGAGVDGLVVAGTGHGTVHQTLEAALLRAHAQGVRVLRASRVGEGAVWPRELDRLPAAGALSAAQARVELILELLAQLPPRLAL